MLINTAHATTEVAGVAKPSSFSAIAMNLLPFVLIFAVFYFILILPQRRKQKKHKEMMEQLKSGDKIVLSSGIVGSIVKIKKDSDIVTIKTAESTDLEIYKNFIANKID